MQLDRLQKIIAHAGFASRREAEAMIREGRVTVNGRVVTALGTKADADRDHIKVDGKLITRAETHRYILLYKPREVTSTVNDPEGRKTVVDLVKGVRERIYPVGRLDYQSEGLLLLTNDGDLAFKVSHPKHGSVKTYHVKVRGIPDERIVGKLERGITIDGKRTVPCEIQRMKTTGRSTGRGEDEGNSWYEVRLRRRRSRNRSEWYALPARPGKKARRRRAPRAARPRARKLLLRSVRPAARDDDHRCHRRPVRRRQEHGQQTRRARAQPSAHRHRRDVSRDRTRRAAQQH